MLGSLLSRKQILRLITLAIANLLFSLWMGQQAYRWMPPQASAEAMMVDRLFSFMTVVGSFIFVGVIAVLVYSMIFQRATKYDISDGPPVEGNVVLEVIWTAIPILLVIWIATASFQTYQQMSILGAISAEASTPKAAIAAKTGSQVNPVTATAPPKETQLIEVRARQWAWEFYYSDPGISSTELHLPINQRARLKLISEDVLHGFYVPAFRVKQDIVPGKVIDFSLTPIKLGRYRIRDSEYSGTYFAINQTDVVVQTPEAYQQWLVETAKNPLTLAPNQAYEEFMRDSKLTTGFRYETIQPAPAPMVNYFAPSRDRSSKTQP